MNLKKLQKIQSLLLILLVTFANYGIASEEIKNIERDAQKCLDDLIIAKLLRTEIEKKLDNPGYQSKSLDIIISKIPQELDLRTAMIISLERIEKEISDNEECVHRMIEQQKQKVNESREELAEIKKQPLHLETLSISKVIKSVIEGITSAISFMDSIADAADGYVCNKLNKYPSLQKFLCSTRNGGIAPNDRGHINSFFKDLYAEHPLPKLHNAAFNGDLEEVLRLLDSGSDPDAKAPGKSNDFIQSHVEQLAREGEVCNGDIMNAEITPLHLAGIMGHLSVVKALLEAMSDDHVLSTDSRGVFRPLINDIASAYYPEILKLILNRFPEIDITAADCYGDTSLMSVVRFQGSSITMRVAEEVVEILIASGVNIEVENNLGQTALSLAEESNNWYIADLLKNNANRYDKSEL